MPKRAAITAAIVVFAIAMVIGETDPKVLTLQAIFCAVLSFSTILALRPSTENAILAGTLMASLITLALVIAAPLVGQARSFEVYLVHEFGVAAGAFAALFAARGVPRRGETGHG